MTPKTSRLTLIAAVLAMAAFSLEAIASEAPAPAPPQDLIGHWTFDADTQSSLGGWTAQLDGGALVGQPGAILGAGTYHNGPGEGYLQTNLSPLDGGLPQSISLWIKSDANTGTEDTFFNWGNGGFQANFNFGLLGPDLRFLLGWTPTVIPVTVPLNNGEWRHLLISRANAGSMRNTIYLDGKLFGSTTDTLSYYSPRAIQIGTAFDRASSFPGPPDRDFNGSIDDFAYFNSALSASDAALIHGLAKLAAVNAAGVQPARWLAQVPVGSIGEIVGRSWTVAEGLPGTTGDFGGSLATGDAWIALSETGRGIRLVPPAPPAAANPLALEAVPTTVTVRSGDVASFPFQLRNTGATAADWHTQVVDPSGDGQELSAVLGRFAIQGAKLLGSLPTQQDFDGGITGSQLDSEPFAGGNKLETNLGGPIPYSDRVVATSAALGANGRYFTMKLPGLFLFAGDADGPSLFRVTGTASRNFSGEMRTFSISHAGRTWKAFAINRTSTWTPYMINQLMLIDDPHATADRLPTYSDTAILSRAHLTGKTRIYYALFTQAPNGDAKWTTFEALARTLLDLQSDATTGASVTPATGTLAAGSATTCTLTVDAKHLLPGSYPLALDAQPATGGATAVRAPFTLQVTEPAMRFGATSLDRAGLVNGQQETVNLSTQSALDHEQAWTARLIGGGPWVTLLTPSGTTPQPISLRFTPGTPVYELLRASLEVKSGTSTYLLPITYAVETFNPGHLVMDPLRDRAYVFSGGVTDGLVVVMNPSRNTVIKVIRVGHQPRDLAFSPNGAEVYVLSSTEMEIARIDPVSLEVTARRLVPGIRGSGATPRLAVDREGRVFYTDVQSNPALRMVDFASGELLDTLTWEDLPRLQANQTTGFGDVFFHAQTGELYFTRRNFNFSAFPRLGRIATDGNQLTYAEEWSIGGNFSGLTNYARIFSDLDGKRLFASGFVYEHSAMSSGKAIVDRDITNISAYGDFVLTQSAIFDGPTGQKLIDLPLSTELAAFNRTQTAIFYYDGSGKFVNWPLPASIRPLTIGIRPEPPDGGALELGQNTLRWSSLPQVDGYRIFLGTSAAAVAAAQPGGPEDKGVVPTNAFTMNPPPTSGPVFWRVDALRGATVTPGTVFSFSPAPFQVTPQQIEIVAPQGARPQRFTLAPADAAGNPVAWSASSASPWITMPRASGTASDPLVVELNPATLALGSHSGTVRVTHSGLTLEIPVQFQLFKVDLHRLLADPARPVVYGLQLGEPNQQPSTLITIDAATGDYLSSRPLTGYASDFAIHPLEDRLYLPLTDARRIEVIDLADGARLTPIPLPAAPLRIGRITTGRAGRLFIETSSSSFDNWEAQEVDTVTGQFLRTLDRGFSKTQRGTLACDSSGRFFYRESEQALQRTDVSVNPPLLLESATSEQALDTSSEFSHLSVSRDGSRVLSNRTIFSADLRRLATVESDMHAISSNGQWVAGPGGVFWAETGFKIASLPVTTEPLNPESSRVVISSGDAYIVMWDEPLQRTLSVAVDSLVTLPGPTPLPGARLSAAPGILSWAPVPGATAYQVFLGTNPAAVTAAGFSSPLRIGTTTTPSLALPGPLAAGLRYHWRVDALTPTGTVKGTTIFFDLPFQPHAQPIVQPAGRSFYAPAFGGSLAAGPDGLLVEEGSSLTWYHIDAATGNHRLVQEVSKNNNGSRSLAAGPGILVSANWAFNPTDTDSGAVFLHGKQPNGFWQETARLTGPPDEPVNFFGHAFAYDANQLLVQQGSVYNGSGRVFPHFEHPGWQRGPELIPNPRQTDDRFGAAIAMDGTRALIGAPGTGIKFEEKGYAFVFDYDAAGKQWLQRARLVPSQGTMWDQAGLSVALSGNHAALGSGAYQSWSAKRVHVFNRRSASSWVQTATLEDPSPVSQFGNDNEFGRTLLFSGDLLFVAAPAAAWRGQSGGVIYVYRYNGTGWDAMAPILPPPGGHRFGSAMTARDGWLFVSRFQADTTTAPDEIFIYRIADPANRQPQFTTTPPIQVLAGKPTQIDVHASDPDGPNGLVFRSANLPPGLALEDLGGGRAKITGTPTDSAGTQRWVRIAIADASGAEAVQTSLLTVIPAPQPPVVTGLPAELEVIEGEELVIRPQVSGAGPITWQWRRDGVLLDGATGPTLMIAGTRIDQAGRYTATATNLAGSTTSSEVTVRVRPADRFASDWTTFGSGNNRDGHQSAILGRHRFQQVWQAAAQPGFFLNPVAIAAGKVFVTSQNHQDTVEASAYDLTTGALVWQRPFADAPFLSMPTYYKGRIYVQRDEGFSGELWSLDANTGAPVWNTIYATGWNFDSSVVADASGLFFPSGGVSGVYGFELDGRQRFLHNRSSYNPRMATLAGGRLFAWNGRIFTEIHPQTGSELWSMQRSSFQEIETFPLVQGSRAYLMESQATVCIDVNTRQVIWEIPRSFSPAPAFGMNRLFVHSGTMALALSPEDGSELTRYVPPGTNYESLVGQPLVLNDHLIVASSSRTSIFNITTGELVQQLPHGGNLAYSAGHLLIAGENGILRAYFANAAPMFSSETPTLVAAAPAADATTVSMLPFANDPDPNESLAWSIKTVSRPDLLSRLEIDPTTGELIVVYNPWQSGESQVTLVLTDAAGNASEHTLTFTVPPHPAPALAVSSQLTLNRQTGLYEQTITITNSGAREIAGFDLTISGLPPGVAVNNASTRSGDDWYIHHRQPLAAGASVKLVIEYHTLARGTPLNPQVTATVVNLPEAHQAAPDGGLAVERCIVMPDGSILVEFTATPGALYEVHYSHDGIDWNISPIRVRAAGNRVQWIDSGPPRTATPPAGEPSRFYRVRHVPEP